MSFPREQSEESEVKGKIRPSNLTEEEVSKLITIIMTHRIKGLRGIQTFF